MPGRTFVFPGAERKSVIVEFDLQKYIDYESRKRNEYKIIQDTKNRI